MQNTSNDEIPPPARTAEELAQLAAEAEEPGARLWFLEWAKAFSQLAAFGAGRSGLDEDD